MVLALIYGGEYKTTAGETRVVNGCKCVADCEALKILVTQKFPAPSSLKYMNKEAETIFTSLIDKIQQYKALIPTLQKNDNSAAEKVRSEIKSAASVEANNIVMNATADIIAKKAADEKQLDKSVAEAKKGLRRTVKFEVVNTRLIPSDYLMVDDAKVNEYISINKEGIMQVIKEGGAESIIPGIKFIVHDQNIGR